MARPINSSFTNNSYSSYIKKGIDNMNIEKVVLKVKKCLTEEMKLDLTSSRAGNPYYYTKEESKYNEGCRFTIPCCCLGKGNAYGYYDDPPHKEGEPFNIDNPHLKELIEKYPKLFNLEDCSYCCGCGDW